MDQITTVRPEIKNQSSERPIWKAEIVLLFSKFQLPTSGHQRKTPVDQNLPTIQAKVHYRTRNIDLKEETTTFALGKTVAKCAADAPGSFSLIAGKIYGVSRVSRFPALKRAGS